MSCPQARPALVSAIAAAAACLFSEDVFSQSTAPSAGDPSPVAVTIAAASTTQRVDVTAHYENAIGTSDAASQGTVRGERLTDLPLLRPGEVLETIPGMVVAQHSGDGKANQYFLRGYNLDHGTDFATQVDGVPVNMPSNTHGQGYTDLNFLIPELIDRIEYRKGPYFAQDGDFASAGSARIRYLDHLDHAIADTTVGDNGYRRLLLAGSPRLPGVEPTAPRPRLLTALELEGDDGPWTRPERARKFNALVRLSDGDVADGWSIDGIGYASHWNSTDQVPLELIQSGQLGRYAALDPTDGGNTTRDIVSGEWHRHDAGSYTRVSAYAEHETLRLWSNFTFFELRPATGDQFEQQETRNMVGAAIVRGWEHALWGRDSTTEVGVQVRHDHTHDSLSNTQARVAFQTVSDDHVGETSLGVYARNSTTWLPWLRSQIGLRADRFDMKDRAVTIPANSGSATGSRLSPKLSLVFGPWRKTEFFANAGRGFHSNDARGVIGRIDATTGNVAARVPVLAASRGAELGLRSEIVPGLQTSLAVWRLDSDSELVFDPDSAIGSTEPNGASKRHGIEWNNHLVVNRWLLVDADMAWTHARYASANANGERGDLIPNAVSRVGMLGVTLHELGPWSAGLSTRFIGRAPLSQDGTLTMPGSVVSNLQLKRVLNPHCTAALDVLNLFDRRFYDMAYEQDYRVAPGAPVNADGVTVHPGEPREFRVSLNLTL